MRSRRWLFWNFKFNENVGLTKKVKDIKDEDEAAYYNPFVDDGMIDMIVEQTNVYADQAVVEGIVNETIGPFFRLNKKKETNRSEIYCPLGIMM